MYNLVHVFCWKYALISFLLDAYLAAELICLEIAVFRFSCRYHWTIFCSSFTNSPSHQQCIRMPIFTRLCKTCYCHSLKRNHSSGFVQFSSVTQLCPTLCDPMNCSMPGLPVHHQLPEFTQTYVHRVSDAIQPSHPLSSPSPPAPNPSQHQSLFQWISSSHEVA